MPRYKLALEYDGRDFVGWQYQENGPSVQAAIENAIEAFCGERVTVHGAGRTDAGVHALGQVAHVDLAASRSPTTVRDAVNFHLKPARVVVLAAEEAGDDFHARFSATERVYRYRIVNRRAPPVLERGRCWWVPVPLDAEAMNAAAQRLVGRHDFTSFRAAICQARSPVKTMNRLSVRREDNVLVIEAAARSFLHNQVRIIAGTLKAVGEGRETPDGVAAALAARDRRRAGQTAPPEGLYLVAVRYGSGP